MHARYPDAEGFIERDGVKVGYEANPVLHADQVPAGFPGRDRLIPAGYLDDNGPWLEGNTVVVAPGGAVLADRVRQREETLIADLGLRDVTVGRRHLDPAGHYNRPDIFRCRSTPRRGLRSPNPALSRQSASRTEAAMNTTPVTSTPMPEPAAAGVLVSPAWLQARLHDPAVRVVEVDVSRAAYNDWHIDGAVLWTTAGPSWISPACARSSQLPAGPPSSPAGAGRST